MSQSTFSEKEIKYYTDIDPNIKVSFADIDPDRIEKISNMGTLDVANRAKKRKASEFKNKDEYNMYLLSVYEAGLQAKRGVLK